MEVSRMDAAVVEPGKIASVRGLKAPSAFGCYASTSPNKDGADDDIKAHHFSDLRCRA
jgi:hypothetical protein